jgi:hypothetical protein
MTRSRHLRTNSIPALLLAVLLSTPADADAPRHTDGEVLTGRQIYAGVLQNRLDAFSVSARLASGSRGGRVQESRIEMDFQDLRRNGGPDKHGVISMTRVRYTHPFDFRHAGYLVIQKDESISDQFVYLPTRRKTLRVNLRGKAVLGTDFSLEDVIPRELQQATYRRVEDEELDGVPVYVVEARPTDLFDSEYSQFVFYVDRKRFIPLRTRYWDLNHVEVKELRVAPDRIERFDDVHIPMLATMRHLLLDSYTTLEILELDPNPIFPASTFEKGKLETH